MTPSPHIMHTLATHHDTLAPRATQHEEPEFCKQWLSVSPVWGLLRPGESIDISLTTYVDERSVRAPTHSVLATYDIALVCYIVCVMSHDDKDICMHTLPEVTPA